MSRRSQPRICSACRAPLHPGWSVCARCGEKIRRGGRGVWAGAIVLVLGVVAGTGAAYYFLYYASPPARVSCSGGRCPQIGAAGGRLAVTGAGMPLDYVRVDVPAGALRRPVEVSISEGKAPDAATLGPGVAVASPAVELQPEGTRFDEPVSVRLPFFPPAGARPDQVRVALVSRDGKRETLQPTEVDVERRFVRAELEHFSVVFVTLGATPGQVVVAAPGEAAAPPPAEQTVFDLTGDFTLNQYDQRSRCAFSEGPLTFGKMEILIDVARGTVSGSMKGGGGSTRSVSCSSGGAKSGVQSWTQDYSATFSGTIDANGRITAQGPLQGQSTATYSGCTKDGEADSCPPARSDRYRYTMTLGGGFNRTTREAQGGTIDLAGVPLETRGTWTASPRR